MSLFRSWTPTSGRTSSASQSTRLSLNYSNNTPTSCGDGISNSLSINPAAKTLQVDGNLRLLLTLECPTDVMCCQFTTDGKRLAVGLSDATIRIYDVKTGQFRHQLIDDNTLACHLPVTQIRFRTFAPDEQTDYMHILIASYASGDVKVWHYTSGTCLYTLSEERQTMTVTLNPDKSRFLTAGSDALIHIYDLESKKRLNTCAASDSRHLMDGHRFRIFATQYHPYSPNIFLSGGWDDTVQYWDDRKQHAFRKFAGPHICGEALDIDPVQNQILTGSWRRGEVLQIWDFPTGCKIKDIPQNPLEPCLLYCAQWMGDDCIVSGGSNDNMAQIHDRSSTKVIGRLYNLPNSVYCIDNDGNSNCPTLAVGFSRFIYILRPEAERRVKIADSVQEYN